MTTKTIIKRIIAVLTALSIFPSAGAILGVGFMPLLKIEIVIAGTLLCLALVIGLLMWGLGEI